MAVAVSSLKISIFWTTATAIVTAAAAAVWLSRDKKCNKSRHVNKFQLSWLLRLTGGTVLLSNVKVPVALVPESVGIEADLEGFVSCSIMIRQGKISDIMYGEISSSWTTIREVDCGGSICISCFVDAHTHLIKTHVVPRLRNTSGTINEALQVEQDDLPNWSAPGDVQRRMEFAIQTALHHGSKAIRTHLDGTAADDPDVVTAVYKAFDDLRDKYATKMIIQGVANLFLPLWLDPAIATPHADRAKEHANVVLGAYVPPSFAGAEEPEQHVVEALDALFGHAQRLAMDVDMHIDETNEPRSCALTSLCVSLAKARKGGYQGRVVLGHCCALSLQPQAVQQCICNLLAKLGAYVVSNPFTNLGLQDRMGTKPPMGALVPDSVPRTPQWRGLTLLQELREAGVIVASASDNVRDHWYPYGDYDMLSVWAQAQGMGHLDTAPSEGAWADLVTIAPAQAMGITSSELLAVGQVADLILFPSARRASELFARPQTDRIVLRQGQVQSTSLPDFHLLDDLVSS